MRSLRVLALVPEGRQPPDSLEGIADKEIAEWKMEYDVLTALHNEGHEATCLDVGWDLTPIRQAVLEWKPHVVFNMLEEFHGQASYDANVVAYLELMQAPYTGCNPRGLVLARDKALTKKILTYHRIPTARFAVVRRGRKFRSPRRLRYPLFVKSTIEDASAGISQASIVSNEEQLQKRVEFVHESTSGDALVEEYIDGRELYLSVMGNRRLETFPIWELVMDGLPEGTAQIATRKLKFDLAYQEKHGITTRQARDLDDALKRRIQRMGKRIYRILGLSGYARIDLRMREDGSIFVLEVNPNPDLSADEDFALSVEAGGIDYDRLIRRIVSLGMRYR